MINELNLKYPQADKGAVSRARYADLKLTQGYPQISAPAKTKAQFHHMLPYAGFGKVKTGDVMILDKYLNATIGPQNLELNRIAKEIVELDFNGDPDALKKLDTLNLESKKFSDEAKTKLPKKLKGAVGYIRYEPVFDSNGVVIDLKSIGAEYREGVDDKLSLKKFTNNVSKNIKDFNIESVNKFKTFVKNEAKNFSEAEKLKVCNFLANGGLPGDCARAIDKDPIKAAQIISEVPAETDNLSKVKNAAKSIQSLMATGQVTTADKLPRPDDAKLADTFKETNLRWNNDVGAFVTGNEDDIASQADIKKYAADNPMEVKVGEEPVKTATNKSVLANVGKALARVGAPLPVAAIDSYFIGKQVAEGKGTAEIASNPLNWLGLATMEPLAKASGIAEPGKLNTALRLGLNPATIRGITRFAGLPGLAVSTAMTAYDQYQKYKDGEGFIYNLLNQKGIE